MSHAVMFHGKGVSADLESLLLAFEQRHSVQVRIGALHPCTHKKGTVVRFHGLIPTGASLRAFCDNGYFDVYVATSQDQARRIQSVMATAPTDVLIEKPKAPNGNGHPVAAPQMVDWKHSEGPSSGWLTITPEMASHWLNTLNTHNRPLKAVFVAQYAQDMREGRWEPQTHQGIAFHGNPFSDPRAVLLDGQNRLYAVTEAGVAVVMQVTINLPLKAQAYMDSGAVRSAMDVYKLEHQSDKTDDKHAAIARAMIDPLRRINPTRAKVVQAMIDHRKAIEFAVKAWGSSNRRRVAMSVVKAVVARAWYTQPKERLERFAELILHGIAKAEHESAAILLRNWLMDTTGRHRGGTRSDDVYLKTQSALRQFLDGRSVSRNLYATTKEYFLLPGEETADYTRQ